MQYHNPKIPEGINTTKTSDVKEFFHLSLGVFGLFFLIFAFLGAFADRFAHHIPYQFEKDIMLFVPEVNHVNPQLQRYLDQLSEQIEKVQQLEPEMEITIHYVDSPVVNAYATLGGHVILTRGLLEQLSNENALAMVMAHEIAHIKHRHPIRNMGRGIALGVLLTAISSSLGDVVMTSSIDEVGFLTILKYSRDHEWEADETAMQSVMSLYGHVHGAEDLFVVLKQSTEHAHPPEFLSTHPDTDKRLEAILARIEAFDDEQPTTPLPARFTEWLSEVSDPGQ